MAKVIRPVDRDDHEALKADLKKANERIDSLILVVGNLTAWLVVELGHKNVNLLIEKLEDI